MNADIPVELHDLLFGLDDERVDVSDLLIPVRRANGGGLLVNYDVQPPVRSSAAVPTDFAELVAADEISLDNDADAARFLKKAAIPMSPDGLIDYTARATVLCKSAHGIPSKGTIGDEWWRSHFAKNRTPEASAKCVTEFYRKYFEACNKGDYDLAKHYLKEMVSC